MEHVTPGRPAFKLAAALLVVFIIAFMIGYIFGYYDAAAACSGSVWPQ
jgi:hypothetical protein